MNKKFLSAILFGALMITSTGTFVSCKDYDDDINDLQTQIDNLATKSDVEAKLSQLQTAISAAQSEANNALAKANEALTAAKAADDSAKIAALEAEIDALEAKIAAFKSCSCDVEALKAEIKEATDAQMKEFSDKINAVIEKAEGLVGEVADYVTSVELVASYSADEAQNWDVVVSTAIEKDNVFSEGIENAITFEKGTEIQTPNAFLVRVSPANAVLEPEMIQLVNSKGQTLDEVLEVKEVKKADVLLSRGTANHGLWTVSVQAKNYGDGKAFKAATTTKISNEVTEQVLFAVQVNNTLSEAEARYVTSSYDLTFDWTKYEPANELNYFVDATNIANVNNRYDNSSVSLKETSATISYKELVWIGDPAVAPISDPSKKGYNAEQGDNRSKMDVYPAVQGEAIKIALSSATDKVVAPENIRAIYVTLDKANAVESAPSELNAWNSYTYSGLNKVVEGTSTEIIINSTTSINDVIGFRVYAVNYDGTLVDPDGKAFYVQVGDKAADWNILATTIVPLSETVEGTTDTLAVSLTKLTGATEATWTTDKIGGTQPVFHATFMDKDGKYLYGTNSMLQSFPEDFTKVAKVYAIPALNDWKLYEDGKAYNGTLAIKNASGHVLAKMNITFTKQLPTGIPAGFSVKTAQVANGIYNCYLQPMPVWAADQATTGEMKMTEVFNFGEGELNMYNITFADSKIDNNKLASVMVKGDASLSVAKDFIDNKTEHATTVEYNYGMISSVKNAQGDYDDVKRSATEFKTVYNCIYNNTYTWAWATDADRSLIKVVDGVDYEATNNKGYVNALPSTELTYGTDKALHVDCFIKGTSAWDGLYNAILNAPYSSSLRIDDATLTSDANGEEEYFDVTVTSNHIKGFVATKTSSTTNPTEAVPSTLTIKCTDMYGHEVVIKLPMTVNKR